MKELSRVRASMRAASDLASRVQEQRVAAEVELDRLDRRDERRARREERNLAEIAESYPALTKGGTHGAAS